jgi:hypothetical protein
MFSYTRAGNCQPQTGPFAPKCAKHRKDLFETARFTVFYTKVGGAARRRFWTIFDESFWTDLIANPAARRPAAGSREPARKPSTPPTNHQHHLILSIALIERHNSWKLTPFS